MKIKEMLNEAIYKFKLNKIDEPIAKAKLIVSFSIQKEKEYLITHDTDELSQKQMDECYKNIDNILLNIPIQYIVGYQEFMKLIFKVTSDVLIPRADTEILVEAVINLAQSKNLDILDLCTGSGAIAISLKKYLQQCNIVGSDISEKALKIAKENSILNQIDSEFIKSDLFENIDKKFDIIVSNPPYIETETIKLLSKEVQKEPILALDGGYDGLYIYRSIISQAYLYLKENGLLCLEIGYNQKEKIIELITNIDKYDEIYSKKDLSNNDRIVICRRK